MIFSKLFNLFKNTITKKEIVSQDILFKNFLQQIIEENPYSQQDLETKEYIDNLIDSENYDKVFDILETGTFLNAEQTFTIFENFHYFLNYGARPLQLKNEYVVTDLLANTNYIPFADKLISLVFHPSLDNILGKSIENNFLNPEKDLKTIYTGSTLLLSNSFELSRYSNPYFNKDKVLYFDFLGKFFSLYSKNKNYQIPKEFSQYISVEDFVNFVDAFKQNKEIRELYFSSSKDDFFKDIKLETFKNSNSLFLSYLKQYQNKNPVLSGLSMNGHLFNKTNDSNYPQEFTNLIPIYSNHLSNFFVEYNSYENSEQHSDFLKNLSQKILEISKNNLNLNTYSKIFQLWNIEPENKKQIMNICKTLLVLQADEGESNNFANQTFKELVKNIETSFQIKEIEPSSSFLNEYLNNISNKLKTVLHEHNNQLINNLENNNVINKRKFR